MLPRYLQLYEHLRHQILEGLLSPGTRLPSSRNLSKQFQISRNTAIAAVEQLCSEGYAKAKAGSGIYILPTLPTEWAINLDHEPMISISMSSRGQKIYQQSQMKVRSGPFTTGVPDLKLFPFALWNRYVARYARNPRLHWQAYPQQGGLISLRTAIANHLRISRGIQCLPEQVLMTHGTQNSLQLAAHLLTDPKDQVWMENPGYPGARSAFVLADLQILGQPIDAEGMAPIQAAWEKPPRLIYVTPSHQYPLAVAMSAARRRQLLTQAGKHQAWILEDDYDSEFRYSGSPLAALQALSPKQVIYMGTFSKTLFPALQIGYMVLPENLIEPFRACQARHFREPSYVHQNALADFIQEGHYSSHLRKMRQQYQHRKKLLIEIGQQYLGDNFQYSQSDTGLHLTLFLPAEIDDLALELAAFNKGVHAQSLQKYYLPGTPVSQKKSGLVLGFGDVTERDLKRCGKILMTLFKELGL